MRPTYVACRSRRDTPFAIHGACLQQKKQVAACIFSCGDGNRVHIYIIQSMKCQRSTPLQVQQGVLDTRSHLPPSAAGVPPFPSVLVVVRGADTQKVAEHQNGGCCNADYIHTYTAILPVRSSVHTRSIVEGSSSPCGFLSMQLSRGARKRNTYWIIVLDNRTRTSRSYYYRLEESCFCTWRSWWGLTKQRCTSTTESSSGGGRTTTARRSLLRDAAPGAMALAPAMSTEIQPLDYIHWGFCNAAASSQIDVVLAPPGGAKSSSTSLIAAPSLKLLQNQN